MEKILKLYKYVDGINDTPFPNNEQQAILYEFTYDAKRMGNNVPTISGTIMHPLCLDELWGNELVYVTYKGEKYFVKQKPTSSYSNEDTRYKHEISFISERNILNEVYFYDVVDSGVSYDKYVSNSSNVVFYGDINELAQRLREALKYANIDYDVIVDANVASETKLVTFSDMFIIDVLNEAYSIYKVPHYFDSKTIHFGYTNNNIDTILKYGIDNALLSIRKNYSNKRIINRATGIGSADNIPYYYPNFDAKGVTNILYNGVDNQSAIVSNRAKYRKVKLGDVFTYASADSYTLEYIDKSKYSVTKEPTLLSEPYETTKKYELILDFPFNVDIHREMVMYIGYSKDHLTRAYTRLYRNSELWDKFTTLGTFYYDRLIEGEYNISITLAFEFKETDEKQTITNEDIPDIVDALDLSIHTSISGYHNWKLNSSPLDVQIEDYGIQLNVTPKNGDRITFEQVSYIPPQPNLMPPIYRENGGLERFYNALNNTYINPETNEYYLFENPYQEGKQKEEIVSFDYIKPSIVGITNAQGQRIDMFVEFAYDTNDNDEFDENGNYLHPYFFAKLRKFDGDYGFNLFDHAIEENEMKIAMTSGSCGACEFIIGVSEKTQENTVQVDSNGNLLRDSNGNVLFGSPQAQQNDTINNEVWIALKKDIETFGVIMPNATNNYKPSANDTFVILHIDLPDEYIIAAENRLKEEIIKHIYTNNTAKFNLSIMFSRIYLADNPTIANSINENARIKVAYNEFVYTLYVSSYSYRMRSDEPLPEIEVELSEELEIRKAPLQKITSTSQQIAQSVEQVNNKVTTTDRVVSSTQSQTQANVQNIEERIANIERILRNSQGNTDNLQDYYDRITKVVTEIEKFWKYNEENNALITEYNVVSQGTMSFGGIDDGESGEGGGTGITSLYDIPEISINTTTLADGQSLVYDATLHKWVNRLLQSGGGGLDVSQLEDYLTTNNYLTANSSLDWDKLNNTPTTLEGYGITDNVAYRQTWNDLIHDGNEFTFVKANHTGAIWINFRTASGETDGAISEYRFANGSGRVYTKIRAANYIVNEGTSSQFLKADGSRDSTAYWHAGNDGSGSGLDADLLDGLDETRFFRRRSILNSYDSASALSLGLYMLGTAESVTDYFPTGNGTFINLTSTNDEGAVNTNYGLQFCANYVADALYVRSVWYNSLKSWKQLAYVTSTVANADKLDGSHLSDIWQRYYNVEVDLNDVKSGTAWCFVDWDFVNSGGVTNQPWASSAAGVWSFPGRYGLQIAKYYNTDLIMLRTHSGSTWNDWKQLAFTDSNITGNAASATKLQTARTIWGRTFDGTGNITSHLELNNSIVIKTKDTGGTLRNALLMDGNNSLLIGSGVAAADYSTIIYGKPIAFRLDDSTQPVTITSNGNLLVGTKIEQDATYKLYVVGATRISGTLNLGAGVQIGNNVTVAFKSKVTETETEAKYYSGLYLSPANNFQIGYGTATSGGFKTNLHGYGIDLRSRGNEVATMSLTTNGNVLIGTTTEDTAYRLFVMGRGRFASGVTLNNSVAVYSKDTAGNDKALFLLNNANSFMIGSDVANAGYSTYLYGHEILFKLGTGDAAQPMYISSNGNVLIGYTTDDQTAKLNVRGKIRLSSDLILNNYTAIKFKEYGSTTELNTIMVGTDNAITIGADHATKNYETRIKGAGVTLFYGGTQVLSLTSGSNISAKNILPFAGNPYNLGSSDNRWNTIYAASLNLSGNISSGSILPIATNAYTLGSTALYWANLYTHGISSSPSGSNLLNWYGEGRFWNLMPQTTEAHNLGSENKRWASAHIYDVVAYNSVKIGGATLVWDAVNQCLVVDKNFAADGSISFGGIEPATEDNYLATNGGTILGNLGIGDANNTGKNLNLYGNQYFWHKTTPTKGVYLFIDSTAGDRLALRNVDNSIAAKFFVYGNLHYQGIITQLSDMRFKHVIEHVCLSSEVIANAPLFRYKRKDSKDDKVYIGSSAQYWQEVAPELTPLVDDYLTLDYATLGVMMGKSNATEIELLKERVKILEAKVENYERMLNN